jgi:putative Holliday junction resolvase
MGKILAVDYGFRRIGLAITDTNQIIASPFKTIETDKWISEFHRIIPSENIVEIVLGEPKTLQNNATDATEAVYLFQKELNRLFPSLPVTFIDERFTSKMASAALLASGISKSKRRDKSRLDMLSATIILQSYLSARKRH